MIGANPGSPMRILIVNPNTTDTMTRKIGAAGRAAAFPGTEVAAVNPDHGPVSIEGYYDEAFSVPGAIECVVQGTTEGYQGFVLACFDDSGLDACRAAVAPPVVGICEAAMQTASLLAHSFSIVTTLPRSIPVIEALAFRYGMERRLRRVRAADVPVLELEQPGGDAAMRVRAEVLRAVEADRAEAVILGCAGMTDLAAWLARETGVPVLDGVACAVKLVEGLIGLGVATSKLGGYAAPRSKSYRGRFSGHAPPG